MTARIPGAPGALNDRIQLCRCLERGIPIKTRLGTKLELPTMLPSPLLPFKMSPLPSFPLVFGAAQGGSGWEQPLLNPLTEIFWTLPIFMITPSLIQQLISACGLRDPQPSEGAKAVAVQLCTLFPSGKGFVTIYRRWKFFGGDS